MAPTCSSTVWSSSAFQLQLMFSLVLYRCQVHSTAVRHQCSSPLLTTHPQS